MKQGLSRCSSTGSKTGVSRGLYKGTKMGLITGKEEHFSGGIFFMAIYLGNQLAPPTSHLSNLKVGSVSPYALSLIY